MDLTIFLTNLAEWMGVFAVAWLLSLAPQFKFTPVGFRYARRDGLAALFLGAAALLFAYAFNVAGVGGFVDRLIQFPAPSNELVHPLVLALADVATLLFYFVLSGLILG